MDMKSASMSPCMTCRRSPPGYARLQVVGGAGKNWLSWACPLLLSMVPDGTPTPHYHASLVASEQMAVYPAWP